VLFRSILNKHCNHIGFWNGKFSTTEDSTILISSQDAKSRNVNNIAAILVHESMHLCIKHDKIKIAKENEEYMCYVYELDFLRQIPNVEPWLIEHTQLQLNK
jgi:predicted metal-dependent peptidase